MCTQNSQDTITEVITEWTGQERLFTVFELAQEVWNRQKRASETTERYRHIKGAIHTTLQEYLDPPASAAVDSGSGDAFGPGAVDDDDDDDGDGDDTTDRVQYSRNLQDVGAPSQAFVYYPEGKDPSSYTPLNRNDAPASSSSSPTSTAPSTPTPQTKVDSLSQSGDNDADEGDEAASGRRPDGRGTLTVPVYILASAGFSPEDTAYAVRENGELVLSKRIQTSPETTYTVDKAGNVRVNAEVLNRCAGDGPTYDFERKNDTIVVRTHKG